jgi:VWFA-related protein
MEKLGVILAPAVLIYYALLSRCLLLSAAALTLAAQDPQFGVQSRLVLVPVTVTDAKGRAVDGLTAVDFEVLDNGRPQRVIVDTIATGVAPIALMVAIQASEISKPVLEKVRKIGAMIRPLAAGERGCAGVMTFSDRLVWVQECTNDEDAVTRAFEQIRPGAGKEARMLDAVAACVGRLRRHANSRRVLLLISESRDRGSETGLDETIVATQAVGVTVYAATYSAFRTAFTNRSSATSEPRLPKRPDRPSEESGTATGGPAHCTPAGCPAPPLPAPTQRVDILGGIGELARLGKSNTTQALTTGTGGTAFPFTRLRGLEEAIQKLGDELHSQYLLSYTPEDSTAGYHRLEVRVNGRNVRVRARPGYWSAQGPAGH